MLHKALTTALVASLPLFATAQPDYVESESLAAVGYTKYWQLALPLRADQQLSSDAYLVDDQLYLATRDGMVFAVHADTGALRWVREVSRPGYGLRRPCHVGKDVVFVTPTTMLRLDRIYGEPKAIADFGFACSTGVATDGTHLFVGSINHRFYAFDAQYLFEVWKASSGAPIESTPVASGPRLYVASSDRSISSLTSASKRLRWQAVVAGPITADLVRNDSGVFVASRDNSLYLYDYVHGEVRWQARLGGALREPPVLGSELAFQYCADDGVAAIEIDVAREDRRIRWKYASGRTALTHDDKHALILTNSRSIDAVSLKDGQFVRAIPARGFAIAIPSAHNAAMIVAHPDGRIFCARPRGVALPTAAQVREAALPGSTTPLPEIPRSGIAAAAAAAALDAALNTSVAGPPAGGKSKVSREFGTGRSPAAGPRTGPATTPATNPSGASSGGSDTGGSDSDGEGSTPSAGSSDPKPADPPDDPADDADGDDDAADPDER
ncbi:MAG: PQQ-binding-like beta-propeller repeat protein [Phycisphaerales bacterium]|nr:PQQ-binding-like beta-propeller repeat protein [Phycisphaerales bacterium]